MSKKNLLSFFKILVDDLLFTRLRVPPDFLKNLKRIKFPTESTISLKSDPKVSWKVKMEKREAGHVYFTKGWKKVSKDMKLKIGDFVVFYLVGDETAFEIRAYDSTCCERMSGWCPSSRSETESGNDDHDEEEEGHYGYVDGEEETEPDEPTSKKNKSGDAQYPFFQATITNYSLSYRRLTVPWSFVKGHINTECNHQIVTLETDGSRSWPVNLNIFSCPRNQARIYGGLMDFLSGNHVKEGDICTFELINKKKMVFRVSIYRSGQSSRSYM